METALIGLIGVLLGIILNEQLRRRSRIENYSTSVFEKRLDLYEKLFGLVSDCSQVATEVIDNDELNKEQRHELISAAIFEVAEFCDKNQMYLNDELTVHCCTVFMGVEDIHDIDEKDKKEQELRRYCNNLHSAKSMIRKEAGVADIDKLFRSVIKPKHSSAVIDYCRELRKERGMKNMWE